MDIPDRLFIDGRWRPGATDAWFDVRNPADGSVIVPFAAATVDDCLAAVDAAGRAAAGWAATSPRERSELLRSVFELLTAERDRIVDLIVAENGKSHADAVAEAGYATEFFRWFAEEAPRVQGDFRLAPAGDKRIVVTHRPIGVSVLITPWNYPAAMATRKLAPALAAGCTVVLKPATQTPLTAAYVVEATRRVGLPDGVVNLVTPSPTGPAVSAMLHHPAVRKLSFTGSTEVGRNLLHEAADQVLSASMELGGNAPFLLLPGCDIDTAVEAATVAKLRNGGAACTAANRFYVHRSDGSELIEALADRFSQIRLGPGSNPGNDLGALVSVDERDKVAALVDAAVTDGAQVVLGGTPSAVGAFYPATVLAAVEHDSPLVSTEIFGPVAPVIVYDDVDDAVRMANDTIYGLIAYVCGETGEAVRVAQRLEVGMVAVNRGVASDPAAPFGGMKQSGLGREGASEGIEEFLEKQYLAVGL